MLYVTTRNNSEVFTAQRVLSENRGPDGGFFIPFHTPSFSREEIQNLSTLSFNQCIAKILNILFRQKLTGWDLDFEIGRYPVRIHPLGQRILIGECWHNPEWNFQRTIRRIVNLLNVKNSASGDWPEIAARIAVLFGMYSELVRSGVVNAGDQVDISCVCGELTEVMSAWYARQWGLPVGKIICCCNENNEIWNLVYHGQMRTDTVCVSTFTPDADTAVPTGMERLIYACGGESEVSRYLNAWQQGKTYFPGDLVLSKIRDGMHVSVVSSQRVKNTIPSAYATHKYLMSPYSALVYAGLLDYRAQKGKLRNAVVMAGKSPVCDAEAVASALGIDPAAIKDYIE